MKALHTSTIYQLDKITPAWDRDGETPEGLSLMNAAVIGIADFVANKISAKDTGRHIISCFGAGNNGFDALWSAWILSQSGYNVDFFAVAERDKYPKAMQDFLNYLDAKGISVYYADEDGDCWNARRHTAFPKDPIILDGVLGIGFNPNRQLPRGIAKAIEWINSWQGQAQIVAIDIPSGLSANAIDKDFREIAKINAANIVHASVTLTMGCPKLVMQEPASAEFCGSVYVVDLGYSLSDINDNEQGSIDFVTEAFVQPYSMAIQAWNAHKGSLGHVAVIAGSDRYSGAAGLASVGALRGGAGLCTCYTLPCCVGRVGAIAPELIVQSAAPEGAREWSPEYVKALLPSLVGKVVVCGPGMGNTPAVAECVKLLLSAECKGLILDADALNAIAADPSILRGARCPLVITPHPGEAARLLGITVPEVESDRASAAMRLRELTGAIVILKGARTLICGDELHMLTNGNPAMAAGGGMGDVLAGVCGAYLARTPNAVETAACAAAWAHAYAGDLLHWHRPHAPVRASELANLI
ncbi:MAG: NAD(P)H-hydrate dehydratase [Kiritimatiellae bacterium]|nr:NAD(P)H-hydrate dehydratase [Kiritimatiellia bacterium]